MQRNQEEFERHTSFSSSASAGGLDSPYQINRYKCIFLCWCWFSWYYSYLVMMTLRKIHTVGIIYV